LIPVRVMVALGREELVANPSLIAREQREETGVNVTYNFEVLALHGRGRVAIRNRIRLTCASTPPGDALRTGPMGVVSDKSHHRLSDGRPALRLPTCRTIGGRP
jgi:hypothetical protein